MLNHILLAVLFFVLVPGVVLTLPKGGNKFTVAAVHAVVFVVAYYLLNAYVAEGMVTPRQRLVRNQQHTYP